MSMAISSQKGSNSSPILLHRTQVPYFPLTGLGRGSQHLTTSSSVQDPEQTNNSNPTFSFEVSSLTPCLTYPFTSAVTQQPDFTGILESELCFCQNDPQTSHSSIHRYCSLQSSASVSVPALNKLAEILELVRIAWCCPQVNFFFPRGQISLQQTYP